MDNKIKILILLILMCLTVNTVFASDMNDTLTLNEDSSQEVIAKENNNTVLQASKNYGALYQDIHGTQASEINLTTDYIYQSFWDSHMASGVPIKRNVTINGNGHTIDGYYHARIFEIADDSLNIIIKDLHFVNGETTKYGGAISGKCTVINCTFYNNLADKGGALYKASAINCSFELNRAKTEGGAIYIDTPNLNVENCSFVTNYAGKLGGAIAINEVIGSTISNCTFTRNQAENAGSMSVRYSQKVNVTNSKFNSNSAGFNGGAIYYDFALQNILDNCDFENNAAPQDGGAITWILSNGNITNNRFKRNSANGNGGAIYADVSNTAVMIEHQILTDCNFTENSAKNGGALYCGGSYRVTDGTLNFIKNTAEENGGAVYCINSSSFSDSLFLNNKAQNNGGAVYCNDSCRFFGSSFINNNAKNDGGALYANNYGFLFDNQFLNNSARTGGAMYCNEHCTVSKADFINNTAEDDGGAIYSIAEGLIYNIKFNNNSAHRGGAVYIGKYNDIGFCEFTRNYAYQGPAVYTEDNFNEIYNTTFLKNKQELSEFDLNTESYKFNVQLLNSRYLFNAVYSWFPIDCHNITFWNGTVTTMSELDTMGGAGINFTIEVYDSNNKLVKKEIRTTDNDGKIVYDYFDFDGGNYTFKVTHDEDDYYLGLSKTFKITVADFDKLQALLVLAKDTGIINLTRNFTYSIGYDTLSYLGVYSENLTIYGNGYTIDASNRSVSFADELTNITFLNCSFKNGMDFHLRGKNILISDCNFENTGYFRSINASSCQIINCNFDSIMEGSYFSPFEFTDNNIIIIKNSNFTNNLVNGSNGGAIYLRNNSYELIMDCNFINNTAEVNDAGAIYGIDLKNFNLVNSSFINNTAIVGGVLVLTSIEYGIITIDGCMFLNNTAKESASAFKVYGDPVIKNSVFLNNQAPSSKIEMDVVDLDTISVNFEGQNDYINAIVVLGRLSLENVTYWDGTITNTNKKSPNRSSPGQNITINAYDKNDNLIFQTVEKTDENGQLIYAIYNLPYETKYVVCCHEDDAYYARSANVTRNVTRMADFDRLQLLINAAGENGVVNLTRNYTYAEGFETSEYLYINYNNITINGNGYSINFNETGFIYINEANGITLNNISFTGGERQSALMYIGGDCEINDCNFTNISLGSDNVIHQYKINTNLAVNNTNFINITATAIRVDDFTSASICNSDFINNTQAISAGGNTFNGVVKSILISECSFTNNSYINNSAALNLKADTIKIENSNFTNNKGTDGGAIYARANEITVNGSNFFNNSADKNGGAIYIADSNKYLNVDNSSFRFNSADVGPAIYCAGGNCTLNNVTVLDNRGQPASLLEVESTGNNDVVMKFEGKNNYINGIYSKSIEFHNVVYWNGEVVNSDDAYPVENDYSGQKITLEIYNSEDNLVENVTLVTDGQNKIYYKLINGENGNYTFKAYHLDDNYYSYISGGNGTFESIRPLSSVNINIDNGTEFYYSDCNISFDIINKTVTRVVITNIDGTQVYINQTTADDYVIVDLDPSEDYYNITVYNDYTFDYVGSQDSKLFKILKVKPSIIINPISDIYYNNEFDVTFDGENFETVNVTVFDVYGNIVFSEVSSNKYVTIPVLPVGTYNITVTSDEDKYHSNASNSSKFNIIKAYANVTVSVDNVVYGNESMIVIYADVDGVYTVDVNGTVRNVTIDGNVDKFTLYLGAGKYYANVTSFDNGNYSINSTNAIFEVYKAINNLRVITANVTYGSKSVIYVNADVDGVYTVDVNGTIGNVTVEGKVGKFTLLLGAGKYYANVTYSGNGNYSTIISNASFEVYKAVNNVEV
ncbi:right-handed parallel beta-helix repeat-containing protein, partial [Methanobrevibacter sp.]|uniref:right-handed parallel beta-helix repeat-containing protein n=1 Tax=Methanobrevibacter sp. TaxID=66852 RepID=UPI003890D765